MIGKSFLELLGMSATAIADDINNEKSKIKVVFDKLKSYPIKILASFITAPFLILRIASMVENPVRRYIAIAGLILSLLCSYGVSTFLGSVLGALFVASHIGILAGIGVLVGTTVSVFLSVILTVAIFNTVSFIFLKVSTQEVVDYLNEISK